MSPLQSPYDGPFRVLEVGPKYFLIEIGTCQDRVSVDRLKPAQVLQDDAVELARPARRCHPPNPIPDVGLLPLPVPPSPPKSIRHSRWGREVRLPNLRLYTDFVYLRFCNVHCFVVCLFFCWFMHVVTWDVIVCSGGSCVATLMNSAVSVTLRRNISMSAVVFNKAKELDPIYSAKL